MGREDFSWSLEEPESLLLAAEEGVGCGAGMSAGRLDTFFLRLGALAGGSGKDSRRTFKYASWKLPRRSFNTARFPS